MNYIIKSFILFIIFSFVAVPLVFAQQSGIVPAPINIKIADCAKVIKENQEVKAAFDSKEALTNYVKNGGKLADILGCAVTLGRIRLFMLPFFITYLIQFLLGIAGLLSVLFIVIGGYRYVIGGLTEDKESGKKTITNAIIGFLLALAAWIIVNYIQVVLTS